MLKVFGNENSRTDVTHVLDYVYAHGKLETMLRHDILATIGPASLEVGVHPIIVVDNDQNEVDAVAFCWNRKHVGHFAGLVCLPTDHEALDYAIKAYTENKLCI